MTSLLKVFVTCVQTVTTSDIFPVHVSSVIIVLSLKKHSSIIVDIFHFQLNHPKQFCISALLGFCLNGLTIISFRKIKEIRTPSNLLVLSIALADCGICINAFIAAFSSFLRYIFFFLKDVQKNHMKTSRLHSKRSN